MPSASAIAPIKAEEVLELAEKQAASDAMQVLFDRHVENLMTVREQLSIADTDLLSMNIAANREVEHTIKERLGSLQKKMRSLIEEVASRIELQKYATAEEAIQGLRLSKQEREKVGSLVVSDKKVHVSCQSLRVAVEMFCEMNKQIVDKLEGPASDRSPAEERKLVLGNAILVYEITDFSINFIENFAIQGIKDVEAIHEEMKKTISNLRDEQETLRKQAEAGDIEEFLREQVLQDIQNRESSIRTLEEEWLSYMENIRSFEGEVAQVVRKLPNLRLIRDNSKAQINTLAAVAVLQIVRNNIRAIETTVLQLEKLELASLSADRVKRLLGL